MTRFARALWRDPVGTRLTGARTPHAPGQMHSTEQRDVGGRGLAARFRCAGDSPWHSAGRRHRPSPMAGHEPEANAHITSHSGATDAVT
jgi:hypothetical protein